MTRARKIWLSLLALLIVLRIALPFVILNQLNKYLGNFSPTYYLHLESVSLSFFRGAYGFENLVGELKEDRKHRFLTIEKADVSIAWREIFKGHLVTDILLDGVDFALTKELMEASKTSPNKTSDEAGKAAGRLFPVRLERLDLRNSSFEFAEAAKLPSEFRWRVKSINGRLSNVTTSPSNPLALLNLSGTLMEESVLKIVGQADPTRKPIAIELDAEVKGFDLVKANPWLTRVLPLTFKNGKADAYAEILWQNDRLEGYVKPFFQGIQVVGNKNDFLGAKHFLIEILTAFFNLVTRDSSTKTVATKLPFSMEKGEFKMETGEAVKRLLGNGFGNPLRPGIEDQWTLQRPPNPSTEEKK